MLIIAGVLALVAGVAAGIAGLLTWGLVGVLIGAACVLTGLFLRGVDDVPSAAALSLWRLFGAAVAAGWRETWTQAWLRLPRTPERPAPPSPVDELDDEIATLKAQYAALEAEADERQAEEQRLAQAQLQGLLVARGVDTARLRLQANPVHAGMGFLGRVAQAMTPVGQVGLYIRIATILGLGGGLAVQTWRVSRLEEDVDAARVEADRYRQERDQTIEANVGLAERIQRSEAETASARAALEEADRRHQAELQRSMRRVRAEARKTQQAEQEARRAIDETNPGARQRELSNWLHDIGAAPGGVQDVGLPDLRNPTAGGDPNGVHGRASD